MKVTLLGTGTSSGVPLLACECATCKSADWRDKRLRCSAIIEVDNQTLLIDAGTDFRQQMLRENVKKIDSILITHGHKDHTGGLDDVRAYNFSSGKEMNVYTNPISAEMLKEQYSYVFAEKKYPGIPQINLIEIDKEAFSIGSTKIIPIEVLHHKLPVSAFRIGNFTYITDAKTISEEEKEKVRGTKILVINALRDKEHISHFNLEEALAFVAEINPDHTYFIHISHNFGKHADVAKRLPPNVTLAYDGLSFVV